MAASVLSFDDHIRNCDDFFTALGMLRFVASTEPADSTVVAVLSHLERLRPLMSKPYRD